MTASACIMCGMTPAKPDVASAPRRAPAVRRAAPHLALASVAAGLAVAGMGAPVPVPTAFAAAAAACLSLLARGALAVGLLVVALAAASAALGSVRMQQTAVAPLAAPAAFDGRLVIDGGAARRRTGGWRVFARPLGDAVPGGRLLLRLQAPPPEVGAVVRAQGTLRDPAGRDAPGWWRRYLARNGVAAALTPRRFVVVGRRGGVAGLRDAVAGALRARIRAVAPGDAGAVVGGVTLGADEALSERARDEVRDAGLAHLLAVSGQNVGLIAVCALVGVVAAGLPRGAALGVAAVAILVYVLLCEPGASVGRAAVVGLLGLAAEATSRPAHRWYALLVAMVVLLTWQPRSIGDPGLLLSFAAVAGILALAPPLHRALRGWLAPAPAAALAVSVAASLGTAPVLVALFGRLSLVGLAVNLVAVPLAGVVLVAGLAGSALAAVAGPAGLPALWVATGGAEGLLVMARLSAAVPGAAVDLPAWTAPLAAVPLLAALAWLVPRPRAARPGWTSSIGPWRATPSRSGGSTSSPATTGRRWIGR